MSLELLDKTRKINRLLNHGKADVVDFKDFCDVLSDALFANVVLLSSKGKVLGLKKRKEIPVLSSLHEIEYGDCIDATLQNRLMDILSTNESVNPEILGLSKEETGCRVMITPVSMAGKRLGSLLVYRQDLSFTIDDVILNEYAAMVIGLAMQRAESEENSEEKRKEHDVSGVLHTLSKLEKQAVLAVLDEMSDKREAMIITSRLSEQTGITRSVIVNALKKCVGAGVIETRSAGKKGTYVKIINEFFLPAYFGK